MKYKLILLFFLLLPALGFCQQENGEVKKVAILPVVDKEGSVPLIIKLGLIQSIKAAITNTPGYKAFNRDDIDNIMKEQKFQYSGIVSDSTRKKIGEISGASLILITKVAVDENREYVLITAEILNVESGEIDKASKPYYSPVNNFGEACNKLVIDLFGLSSGSGNTAVSSYNSRQQTGTHRNGEVYNPDGIEMVYVEGTGTGILATKSFYIGKYEVTQAQWKAVMGNNPSNFTGDNNPVERVSWNDVQEFISKLNSMTGRTYSLPTEAQWKYAARGGKSKETYEYAGSNTVGVVAWYYDNSGSRTHQVGTKSSNSLGLYDMSGNVWEYCSDCYNKSCSSRVLRGGSWNSSAAGCRVSNRNYGDPDYRNCLSGFRLVLLP